MFFHTLSRGVLSGASTLTFRSAAIRMNSIITRLRRLTDFGKPGQR
jgi:hypothetical protein